ncbi:YraN family protein [Marinovum algicola]|mgnify:FL=1|uniref:YraN family protein n=1 Tax=Marinovum algicola TaxID=42444 RepID=UPI0024B93AF7|nr:YraN family protein [Marinovum algicola]
MPLELENDEIAAARARRGERNHRAGTCAEEAVARRYLAAGYTAVARRWRGKGGEIDLVFGDGAGGFVFVEVKTARDLDGALARISPRQVARIHAAAAEFLADCPAGLDSAARFDAALMDGQGRIEIMEGALLGY